MWRYFAFPVDDHDVVIDMHQPLCKHCDDCVTAVTSTSSTLCFRNLKKMRNELNWNEWEPVKTPDRL